MRRSAASCLSLATLLLAGASGTAWAKGGDKVLVQATFNSDLEGWTTNTPAEVEWNAMGGNPGGEVLFIDASGGATYIQAPERFLSPAIDYKQLDGKAYVSWQHRMVDETAVQSTAPYSITLTGPGGAAHFNGAPAIVAAKNSWVTVAAPLLQSEWTVTNGTWKALLASVTVMQINLELVNNNTGGIDKEAIDNVEIVSHPQGFSVK
jgi:hypothetical protein